ncbi:receptor for retinol uptake stra6-like isoform X2 [Polyodon spathula]|uniref:receptor for retinol uptake stra6-like isoform X2 n=1 Tax=Polyodon spathula TaxID=7913 RepID=UPI001B7E3D22|nr:receptor for retinol uptake stra6-like isoform X2 [Polyodon spathula]
MMSSNVSDVHEYYDYADLYSNKPARATVPPEEIILPCFPTASDKLYHTCISALSLVVLLILAAFTKRKRMCQGFLKGVPGLLSPVNFLDHTQHKGLAGTVFGVLFCRLVVVVLAKNPLPFTEDPAPENKEYWKILALFYYPALYYPLLACGTLHSRVGYVLGSLLSWTHFSVLVWQKVDCPQTPEIYKFYSLLSSLPQIVCLAFLSFQYPLLLFKNSGSDGQTNTSEDLHSSYYKEYVQKILRKKVTKSSTSKPTTPSRISAALQSYIYAPEDGFRFPLKLAISAVVSIISVYQVMLLLVLMVIPTLQKVRAGVNEDIAFLLAGFNIILSENRAEVVEIVKKYLWTVEVCYISSVALSGLVTLVMLMRSMVLHRSNLKGLYRGDIYSVYNRKRSIQPSRPAIVCWMGFTSYQAALVCIALFIQALVFFICILWFVFLILIPVLYGQNLILFQIFKIMWPFWLMLCLVVIIQHGMAKFAFLKKDAGMRDLDNRQGLFLLTYLLFPVNILVGVLLGAWRIVITGLFNIIHLGRLDISLLNRGVESFDPGYRCYVHYLKIEVSQSHPVMKAFCSVLLQPPASEGTAGQKMSVVEEGIHLVQQDKKQKKISSSRRVRGRWWLVYTLVNNPSLVASRKRFQVRSSEDFLNGTLNRTSKGSVSEPEKTDPKLNDM